jgi:hypothetical protein
MQITSPNAHDGIFTHKTLLGHEQKKPEGVLTLSLLQQTKHCGGPFGQLSNMGAIQVQKATTIIIIIIIIWTSKKMMNW